MPVISTERLRVQGELQCGTLPRVIGGSHTDDLWRRTHSGPSRSMKPEAGGDSSTAHCTRCPWEVMMKMSVSQVFRYAAPVVLALGFVGVSFVSTQVQTRKPLTTEEDFNRATKELSNWGRWGADDELGAANLITPAKRKQAAALVKEGLPISLAHDIFQEEQPDGRGHLERKVVSARPGGASDQYAFVGTYHGSTFSHLDAINCHQMINGKGYNGRTLEEVQAADGCPKG